MKGKREQDESGPKDITPTDTVGPVPAKHVMKKVGAFVTSLVVAIIVYVVHGIVYTTWFVQEFRNTNMLLSLIDLVLMVALMIAAALLTYRALNKKIERNK